MALPRRLDALVSIWTDPLVCTLLTSEVRARLSTRTSSSCGLSSLFRDLDPPVVEEARALESCRRSRWRPLTSVPVTDVADPRTDPERRSGAGLLT